MPRRLEMKKSKFSETQIVGFLKKRLGEQ